MKQTEFQELMRPLGFQTGENLALGSWEGWPVQVKCQRYYGICDLTVETALSRRVESAQAKVIQREIKQHKGCSAVIGVNAVMTVQDRKKYGSLEQRFTEVMNALVQGLREAGATPPVVCPLCKGAGCDSMALISDNFVPTHRACVEQMVQGTRRQAEQQTASGNYVTGLIGALLGGLVGTLPNILAALLLHRVIAILYALIPIFAYYGYKLLKGKMNKGAFVCTLLSSAVNLFVMQYLYVYVIFVQRMGQMLSPGDALSLVPGAGTVDFLGGHHPYREARRASGGIRGQYAAAPGTCRP